MMASDTDEVLERLIEDVRPKLRELLKVEQVLDHLYFVESDQKDQIRQRVRTDGDQMAADVLINAVMKKPHTQGWFTAFVDALENSGCVSAAECVKNTPVEPDVEAENDCCVRLIQIVYPSLVTMNTDEVCVPCHAEGLLSAEDMDIVNAETAQRGARNGARELLRRIVRQPPGWFSTFLSVLRETDHHDLYKLLGGCSDSKQQVKDGATGECPAAADGCDDSALTDTSTAEDPQDESTDMYRGAGGESTQLSSSLEPSEPDGPAPAGAAAAAAADRDNIVLRDYQEEVARPALEGKNIIICLPTGSGKTRVAVYITKKHLDSRRAEGRTGKVVVLVNKIPLVEQHYSTEFLPFLKPTYKVERVSGDSQLRISFTEIVKNNDVIICTAQILENYLERDTKGEDEGVKLSDLSLIVIDECHHTQKGGVYNHIMMRYLKQKNKNSSRRKVQKEPVPLPQILGLTASPGVGGATMMAKAEEHILRICANLDAWKIMTSNLGNYKREPKKTVLPVEDRKEDPFGDVIKKIMDAIHAHAQLTPACNVGSQTYEQWVVQLERKAEKEENHDVRVCTEHLRSYSEALNLSNTIRMCDAFSFLNKYQEEEMKKKTVPDAEEAVQITDTERFLFKLFKDNKERLQELAKNPQYENESLSELRKIILKEFSSRADARGIIFTKTRRSAIALNQWIQENPKFADIGVKAAYVIGGGDQSVVKPMTSAEQKNVLTNFSTGAVNLLIATTVAEEGLDIPACNLVIRYGLVTNEIAMIQAKGRGRAEDSSYILVEVKNSGVAEKEVVNEHRLNMMNKAIDKIRAMSHEVYEGKIKEFQLHAILENKMKEKQKIRNAVKTIDPSDVKFTCRGCGVHVCTGSDIHIIENKHVVNVTSQFSNLFNRTENTSLSQRLLELESNGFIACKACGERWGSMRLYRNIECPSLLVQHFVVWLHGEPYKKCMKWKDLPVTFADFDYVEHAAQLAESSDEDETE
ncbi:interferon-induced helicase C domain-containing protein 1 [Betta splendens]|uniref:RNA helicase n=1 Tax=Betta splendens TaxID=158456 RepID=A0A6P7LBQ4_BETSP|nr:interferon-induced helicase C domain-containing protein 1 [Betta splendens]